MPPKILNLPTDGVMYLKTIQLTVLSLLNNRIHWWILRLTFPVMMFEVSQWSLQKKKANLLPEVHKMNHYILTRPEKIL